MYYFIVFAKLFTHCYCICIWYMFFILINLLFFMHWIWS